MDGDFVMKLLLFSDLHCSRQAAQELVVRSKDVDVLVGAGDFATCRRGVEITIDVLKQTAMPAVLVPGNSESAEELAAACQDWSQTHVLHGSGCTIDGVSFFGIGGGIPVTPFGAWSYDFTEEEATELLKDCPKKCVLVSHSPPQGMLDMSSDGQHLGSTAVRATIKRCKPMLVVCGHIHNCGGQQGNMEDSPVVNAGPQGIEWKIER